MTTPRAAHWRQVLTRCLEALAAHPVADGLVAAPALLPPADGTADTAGAAAVAVLVRRPDPVSVWYEYIACGGNAGYLEFEAYLHGALRVPPLDAVVLDQVAWEFRHVTGELGPLSGPPRRSARGPRAGR